MDFTNAKPAQIMRKMCIPSVITILIMQIYHMADVFFIGKLNSTAMVSGLSLSSPIISLLSAVGVLFGVGGSAALAMALGRKDEQSANKISSFCFWSSLGLGAVLTVLMLVFLDQITGFLCSSQTAYQYCRQYLTILAIGAPVMCFSTAMSSLIRAKGKSYQSLFGNMIGSILNILLDPLFIFTFGMGVGGAAVATVISNLVSAIFYVFYMKDPKVGICIAIRDYPLGKSIPLNVMSLGLPSSAATLLSFVSAIIANKILASYGDSIIASVSISKKIISMVSMLQMGITSGIQPVLAFHYGAKNIKGLKEYVKLTMVTTLVIGTVLTAFCYLFSEQLVRSFMKDAGVVSEGIRCMRLLLICGPITGIQQLSTTFFQATKKPMMSLTLSLTRDGLIYLPILLLLNTMLGFTGYLLARPVTTFLSALLGFVLMLSRFPKEEARS